VAPMVSGRLPLLLLVFGIGAGLLLAGGLFILFGGRIETTQAKPLAPAPAPVATVATVLASPAAVKPASTATTEPAPASPQGKAVTVTGEQRPPAAKPAVARSTAKAPAGVAPTVSSSSAKNEKVTPKPAVKSSAMPIVQTAVMPPVPDASHPVAVSAAATSQEPIDQVRVESREIPSPGQQWTAPNLVVSNILPVSDKESMAIVNDLPVMEGTMVEDALVKEIHPDRVLFVIDGKSIVIPLAVPR